MIQKQGIVRDVCIDTALLQGSTCLLVILELLHHCFRRIFFQNSRPGGACLGSHGPARQIINTCDLFISRLDQDRLSGSVVGTCK